MTSIRYFNAFLISALTFSLLYFGYLFLPKEKKIMKPAPSKVIKIALITPPKKVAPAPILTPIVPPLAHKKVVKKKIIKPKPKKIIKKKRVIKKTKPKKIVKKKIVKKKRVIKKRVIKKYKPKKVIKKKITKKRIVEEYVEPYVAPAPVYVAPKPKLAPIKRYAPVPKPVTRPISQPIVQPIVSKPTPMTQRNPQNKQSKKAFLQNIRSQIIANKSYPRIAKRRHIEGDIKVRFNISENGQVNNIRFINGKRIFYKSVKKAIERTFPIAIPSNVKDELPIMDVSVTLHFNLR